MKRSLLGIWLAVAVSGAALADDLRAREVAGQAASSSPVGTKYDASLMPLLQSAAAACDPAGTVLPAGELGRVIVVADVSWAGRLINIEVSPATKTAVCVAAKLAADQLASPPRDKYPLLMSFDVSNN